ncbi:hypothetical protein [Thalassotalea ganghwensis]
MKITRTGVLGITLLFTTTSYADITFNGFASIRATHNSTDGGNVPYNSFSDEGEISFKDESLFGLQGRAELSDGLSATIQLYAEGKNDFEVDARWAYLSYELNDAHQVNIGRFANPVFHQSEYEVVGYAHNFSRLPKAVYNGFEFSTVEGISLDSTFFIGDYTLTTKALYGNWDGSVFIAVVNKDVPLGFKDIFSFNATLSGDWWKVFAGGFITELDGRDFDQQAVFPAVNAFVDMAREGGASQSSINDFYHAIGWDTKDGLYSFAGFNINYNDWIVDFEYAYYGVDDSSDGYNDTWYFAVGRRFDDIVVTVHAEEFAQDTDFGVFDHLNNNFLRTVAENTQASLAAREFDGYGVSLRYDFHPSAAFKLDYFSGEDTRASVGDYSIISAGIDLVF